MIPRLRGRGPRNVLQRLRQRGRQIGVSLDHDAPRAVAPVGRPADTRSTATRRARRPPPRRPPAASRPRRWPLIGEQREPAKRRIAELAPEFQLGPIEPAEILPRDGVDGVVLGILRLDDEAALRAHALGRRPQEARTCARRRGSRAAAGADRATRSRPGRARTGRRGAAHRACRSRCRPRPPPRAAPPRARRAWPRDPSAPRWTLGNRRRTACSTRSRPQPNGERRRPRQCGHVVGKRPGGGAQPAQQRGRRARVRERHAARLAAHDLAALVAGQRRGPAAHHEEARGARRPASRASRAPAPA